MRKAIKKNISSWPWHLFGLPLFYVLHQLQQHPAAEARSEAAFFWSIYSGASLLFAVLVYLWLRSWKKAFLAGSFVLAFHFFFPPVLDFLKTATTFQFMAKYSVLLPIGLLLLAAGLIGLQKLRNESRVIQFFNLLLAVLIVIDGFHLLSQEPATRKSGKEKIALQSAKVSQRPDIYLLIADEYPGNKTLLDQFGYNNSNFLQALESRGFHVAKNSFSNYNATVYSMASLLNLQYVHQPADSLITQNKVFQCQNLINRSQLVQWLGQLGYRIYNHSPFQLNEKENPIDNPYFLSKQDLFTRHTLLWRLRKDLGFHFATPKQLKEIGLHHHRNNLLVDSLTKQVSATKTNTPKFVYTHLNLPHHPYYFDSTGKEYNAAEAGIMAVTPALKKSFLGYTVYANKVLLQLVDHILSHNASGNPIIILMSDHGYRQDESRGFRPYQFYNLNAVLFPGTKSAGWYDSISNVNQFRLVLNEVFGQRLPMLADCSFFLQDSPQNKQHQ